MNTFAFILACNANSDFCVTFALQRNMVCVKCWTLPHALSHPLARSFTVKLL